MERRTDLKMERMESLERAIDSYRTNQIAQDRAVEQSKGETTREAIAYVQREQEYRDYKEGVM